jgi:hypothetical protein
MGKRILCWTSLVLLGTATAAFADSLTGVLPNGGFYNTLQMADYYSFSNSLGLSTNLYQPALTPTLVVNPAPAPVATPVATPVAATPAPAASSPSGKFSLSNSFNSSMGGTLSYNASSSVYNGLLSSATSFQIGGYSGLIPPGAKLTGALLDLSLLLGAFNPSPSLQGMSAILGNGLITITSGAVSQTISGFSVTAYDLLAHGFGAALAAGSPLMISFNVNETAQASGYYAGSSSNMLMAADFYSFNQSLGSPMLPPSLTDLRIFNGSGTLTLLTYVAPPPGALVTPTVEDAPEPFSSSLIGLGLGAIAFFRFRRRGAQKRS